MADFSQDEVLGLAKLAGVTIIPEDVEEVTLRLNAVREALADIEQLPLDGVQPIPAIPHPAALPGGDGGRGTGVRPDPSAKAQEGAGEELRPSSLGDLSR